MAVNRSCKCSDAVLLQPDPTRTKICTHKQRGIKYGQKSAHSASSAVPSTHLRREKTQTKPFPLTVHSKPHNKETTRFHQHLTCPRNKNTTVKTCCKNVLCSVRRSHTPWTKICSDKQRCIKCEQKTVNHGF